MAYSFSLAITIDHTKVGGSTLTDYPLTFAGTYPWLATVANGGAVTSANGYDIVFAADAAGTTPLDFERVSYLATNGAVECHVRIPSLSATVDTVIYILFGNAAITTDQSTPTAVWGATAKGIYHGGNGTTFSAADSTTAHSGVNTGGTAVAGRVGGAMHFNGSSQYVTVGHHADFNVETFTIALWAKTTSAPAVYNPLLEKWASAGLGPYPWVVRSSVSTVGDVTLGAFDGTNNPTAINSVNVNDGAWHYIVARRTAQSTLSVQVDNGTAVSVADTTSAGASLNTSDIGIARRLAGAFYFLGDIDEIRFHSTVLSTGRSTADYNNQLSPSTFYAVEQAIIVTAIATGEAWGTAAVYRAGDIYPSGTESGETWGSASLAQTLTVSPSSIASSEAWGTAALTDPLLAQAVSPSGIASAEAWGSNVITRGGTQYLVPAGIASSEAVGFPTLTLVGAPFDQLKALIGGVRFLCKPETCQINLNLNTRGSASITLQAHGRGNCGTTTGSITRPVCGQDIRIIENYRNEFNGFIERISEKVIPGDVDEYEWAVSCVDLASICDRRVVQQTYPSGSARDMILSIVANYLNGEGISTVNVVGTGTVTGGTAFAYKTVAECFNAISRETGEQWWIDPNRDLHFALPGAGPAAPIAFTATDANFQDMTIDTSMSNVATEIIVRSDQNLG